MLTRFYSSTQTSVAIGSSLVSQTNASYTRYSLTALASATSTTSSIWKETSIIGTKTSYTDSTSTYSASFSRTRLLYCDIYSNTTTRYSSYQGYTDQSGMHCTMSSTFTGASSPNPGVMVSYSITNRLVTDVYMNTSVASTTGTSYLTRESTYDTSYLTTESTSAWSGVSSSSSGTSSWV